MLGTRAKITVVTGLMFAILFLALGIRELQRPAPAAAMVASVVAQPPATVASLAFATRPIAVGQTITADLVRNGTGDPHLNPLTAAPVEAIGKVAILPVAAGAPILRSAIDAQDKLAIRVPVGMRAMSIDTTAEIAVAGLVRPGDRVDVQVVYPGTDAISGARGAGRSHATTLLQMVQVLAVGETVVGAPSAENGTSMVNAPPPQARTVTLALTPAQVSTLSLAKNVGSLLLSLRNPTDVDVAEAVPARAQQDPAVTPSGVRPPARRKAISSEAHGIELVVGDRREIIYSGGGAK